MNEAMKNHDGFQEVRIEDWFDPSKQEHLDGYKYLVDEGHWDIGFIPKFVVLGDGWDINLQRMIAEAYLAKNCSKGTKNIVAVVAAIEEISAVIQVEVESLKVSREKLDSYFEKLDMLKDELESICERVDGADDILSEGLSYISDGVRDIKDGMGELRNM